MQITVDDGDVWLIGVPPTGTLGMLERALRDKGVAIRSTTWRPSGG
jgi:anaerobic ribonucleoside-triphosphate reductase activating protein